MPLPSNFVLSSLATISFPNSHAKDPSFRRGLEEAYNIPAVMTREMYKGMLRGLNLGLEVYLRNLRSVVEQGYNYSYSSADFFKRVAESPSLFDDFTLGMQDEAKESVRQVINPQRNSYMVDKIRQASLQHPIVVGIMGATHMYLVAEIMADLKPLSILLNNF